MKKEGALRILKTRPRRAHYFPKTPITTRSTINVNSPALETAAAVSCPEIAEATESPARTSIIMNKTMMPRGVLMMLMIEPVAELGPDPPLPNVNQPSQEKHNENSG